jgi:hypothetical protein
MLPPLKEFGEVIYFLPSQVNNSYLNIAILPQRAELMMNEARHTTLLAFWRKQRAGKLYFFPELRCFMLKVLNQNLLAKSKNMAQPPKKAPTHTCNYWAIGLLFFLLRFYKSRDICVYKICHLLFLRFFWPWTL